MSTSKSFLLGLVDKLDPQDASHTLTLLSLIVLVEDGQSAPPTIHIQNWLSSFRDLRRSILPTLPEASFWQSVLHLCVDHNMGTPLGRHSVPISIPTSPPEGPFLENVRLYSPASWRQRLTLRTIRYHLWERMAPFHPLEVPYHQFLDVFQKHCPFLFSKQQIRAAYAAFHIAPNKRFLILSGLSGTGKTQMLLSFAESYVLASDLNPQEHIVKVSVSPDWRDPSPLLGYINPIFEQGNQKTYVNGEITQFLLRAARYPLLPFFLILDEMNLARVERYFAPFLSGMETPSQPLMLHEDRGQPSGVPSQIDRWPCNLFIGGSVNMDETTHAFSDKVLDRAFTMEYWHIDLERYLDEQQSSISSETRTILIGLYRSLVQAHCHFGYRTVNELLQFVEKSVQMEGSEIERELLDQAICAKILPKIRGQYSTDLERALQESMRICSTHSLPISRSKLSQMLHRLQEFGLTRFWS